MWKVLIFESGSVVGSLIVVVSEGGTGFLLDANASLEDVVWPTDAKEREMKDDLNVGRDATRRREDDLCRAAMVGPHAIVT